MPINNLSVGRDLTFTVVGPTGNLTLGGVTDYNPKPKFKQLEHKDIDGTISNAAIPDGWDISINIDRQDPTVDNFFVALEASYFAGTNILAGTISENIQEADGSVSKYQYTGVSLTYENAGAWKGDALVPISLMAKCSRKLQLS